MKQGWMKFKEWVRGWVTLPARWRRYQEVLRAHEEFRREFNGWAIQFGFAGRDYLETACAIARRCAGSERALKKIADSVESDMLRPRVPGLTAGEIERLACLMEEAGEMVQAAGKILRHGYQGASPFGGAINRVSLEREMGDVRAAMQMMELAGDVRSTDVKHWTRRKAIGMHKWMHHQ